MTEDARNSFDISVAITAHAEGRLAHRTMRSVSVAKAEAEARGLRVEILVVLDTPTPETLDYFSRWRSQACVLDVNHRDPGLSRNAAAEIAGGKYLAIIDADDLLGRQWLHRAFLRAEESKLSDFIIHAEYTIYFEKWKAWTKHHDSNAPHYHKTELLSNCRWTSVLFAPLTTFRNIPFEPTRAGTGFGYEDWHWICNVLAAGGEVFVASGTCKFTRYKAKGSQLTLYNSGLTLLRPSSLFDPRRWFEVEKTQDGGNLPDQGGVVATAPRLRAGLRTINDRLRTIPKTLSRATERYPVLQKTLGAVYRTFVPKPASKHTLPGWLLEQWKEIAMIEPELFPDAELLAATNEYDSSAGPTTQVYERICIELGQHHREVQGKQFTHIYLVPWLKRGGSDLVAIKYVLLTASNPANRVLVIATENSDSPWKVRLPVNVVFLEHGRLAQSLNRDQQQKLLARLLVQLQADVLHNIYSRLATQCFVNYSRVLSQVSRLYAPAFCTEVERSGKLVGEVISSLPLYEEYLTAIISENQHILNYLRETFAIPPAKMFLHYQPVRLKAVSDHPTIRTNSTLHVLWAGRLDRQKRPDLLLEIARRFVDENIHFHVYGSSIVSRDKADVDFSRSANITYHGEFDGLASLPIERFDLFLNTSQWDGMPNILLEAAAEGLPIVTSDVGGIHELITEGITGMLISPFDNVERYIEVLRDMMHDVNTRHNLAKRCRELVGRRHSWEHFASELNLLPGYLTHPCDLERAELSLLEVKDLSDNITTTRADWAK